MKNVIAILKLYKFQQNLFALLFFLLIGFSVNSQSKKEFHNWGITAPIVLDSYRHFEPIIIKAEGKCNAHYLDENLKSYSSNYIVGNTRLDAGKD